MNGYRIGSGYKGSSSVQVSVANADIIPLMANGKPYNFYKFSFNNIGSDCHISINGGDWILLRANQGFNCDIHDLPIYSFKIQESDINFNFIAAW